MLAAASAAQASPFVVTSTLTGDARTANPDGIVINVTITGDTTSNLTNWVIDLNSNPPHPDAALHEFYFNLAGGFSAYSVSNFTPNNWSFGAGTNAQGSGSADFHFEVADNTHNVTNTTNLTFDVTKLAGNFLTTDFSNAAQSCSNDAALGCGQLGAHVGSLAAGQGQSDSGFAMGFYSNTDPNNPPPTIPEPTSLLLTGSGAAWLTSRIRRRRKA
jgi:hypothetical protein